MNILNIIKIFIVLFLNKLIYSTDTFCPFVPAKTQDNREQTNRLRIVQYNVEWMFLDTYSNCPGTSCTWSNQSESIKHINYISNIINDLNPDIINFCEIEGCDELEIMLNLTNNKFRPYLIKGTDSATGQNVGMLTLIDPISNLYRIENKLDYPIPESNCGYTGVGSTGVSKHYITQFVINDINISMISVHLLAYPTDSSRCSAREAQAQILQEQIYNLIYSGNELILLGDLNDWDNLIPDLNSNIPNSQVLDIFKGNRGKYAGLYELKSISDKIPQSSRFSEYWDSNSDCKVTSNEFSMIDHILVTSKINTKIINAYMYHEYREYCGKWNSDHYPVVVDFAF